ncbi:MAG TPA: hypothetical protein VJP77_00560, partial [Planctomycetota bacterium]|nr:hypothetical protein [Planctomycetota bacterium]
SASAPTARSRADPFPAPVPAPVLGSNAVLRRASRVFLALAPLALPLALLRAGYLFAIAPHLDAGGTFIAPLPLWFALADLAFLVVVLAAVARMHRAVGERRVRARTAFLLLSLGLVLPMVPVTVYRNELTDLSSDPGTWSRTTRYLPDPVSEAHYQWEEEDRDQAAWLFWWPRGGYHALELAFVLALCGAHGVAARWGGRRAGDWFATASLASVATVFLAFCFAIPLGLLQLTFDSIHRGFLAGPLLVDLVGTALVSPVFSEELLAAPFVVGFVVALAALDVLARRERPAEGRVPAVSAAA